MMTQQREGLNLDAELRQALETQAELCAKALRGERLSSVELELVGEVCNVIWCWAAGEWDRIQSSWQVGPPGARATRM